MNQPKRASTALRWWDRHKPLLSIEMGGLGKAYEQSIQATVFELIRDCKHIKFKNNDSEYERFKKLADKTFKRIDRKVGGHSNNSWAVSCNLAWNYIVRGYEKSLKSVGQKRLIEVYKGWPKYEKTSY